MRKPSWLFAAVLAALLAGAGCCSPPQIASLPVQLVPQHRDWWCWAASTEMISEYYGHRVDQCQSANFVHGIPPDCCTGCTGTCPGWGKPWGATVDEIKNNWTHWQFQYAYMAGSLDWSSLQKTISTSEHCCHSPIMVIWHWDTGGGHVVVAYGYAQVGSQRFVYYNDPWPPDCHTITLTTGKYCYPVAGGDDVVTTYEAFVDPTGGHWAHSLYNFNFVGQ
jgi:hypothetical protein